MRDRVALREVWADWLVAGHILCAAPEGCAGHIVGIQGLRLERLFQLYAQRNLPCRAQYVSRHLPKLLRGYSILNMHLSNNPLCFRKKVKELAIHELPRRLLPPPPVEGAIAPSIKAAVIGANITPVAIPP